MNRSGQAGQLWRQQVASSFSPDAEAVIAHGDCLETLRGLPDGFAKGRLLL